MVEPIDAALAVLPERLETEICVIGGGAAGLYLAARLTALGVHTVLLEAGAAEPVAPDALGFSATMARDRYAGAFEGRRMGLGGTTSQWGGKLVVPSSASARGDTPEARGWVGLLEVIDAQRVSVLGEFGLAPPSEAEGEGPVLCRRSWHLGFAERNLRTKFLDRIAGSARGTVVLNAQIVALEPAEGRAAIGSARAETPRGPIAVFARRFVIATGAIETTRMLLETERHFARSPFSGSVALGRGLGDHLSRPIARPAEGRRDAVVAQFGPDFVRGRMRSWSFLAAIEEGSAFAHWVFDDDGPGFEVARETFAAIQGRRLPQIAAAQLFRGFRDLAALGWERYARRRLRIARDARVSLNLDMAQPRRSANRISLGEARDRHGRRVAEIAWSISTEDTAAFVAAATAFERAWSQTPGLPSIEALDRELGGTKPFDAYHPVGTTFAGAAADGAVLDCGLKVHGMENLFAASTAAFPDAGDANPTFGLLCLVHALAARLASADIG